MIPLIGAGGGPSALDTNGDGAKEYCLGVLELTLKDKKSEKEFSLKFR